MKWKVEGEISIAVLGDGTTSWSDLSLAWDPPRPPETPDGHAYVEGEHVHPDNVDVGLNAIHDFVHDETTKPGRYAVTIEGEDRRVETRFEPIETE